MNSKIIRLILLLLTISFFIGCGDKKEESEAQKVNRLVNER